MTLGNFHSQLDNQGRWEGRVSNINGETLQIHLGFLFVFRWTNGGRKNKLTDKGYQLKFSDYRTKY